MNIFRNRFLGTASFLSGPKDAPQGGDGGNDAGAGGGAQDQDAGAGKDTAGQADDTGTDADAGDGDDGTGDEDPGDDDSGGADDEGDGEGGDADDEDDDLADLPPEVRAKVEKKIAKEVNWRDRQIDRLHRRTREAQEDVRAAETIVGRGKAPAAGAPDPNAKFTEADVETRARQLTAQQQYDADANATDAKGRQVYGNKWGSQLARLPKMGGVAVEDMVDILATDKPHVVLYSLAANPDEFERIMALPPARRRNEFVKLSLKPEPKAPKAAATTGESKRPSGAPAPVRQIQNGRRVAAQKVDLSDDKVSDDAWYAARNAERRKKFLKVD